MSRMYTPAVREPPYGFKPTCELPLFSPGLRFRFGVGEQFLRCLLEFFQDAPLLARAVDGRLKLFAQFGEPLEALLVAEVLVQAVLQCHRLMLIIARPPGIGGSPNYLQQTANLIPSSGWRHLLRRQSMSAANGLPHCAAVPRAAAQDLTSGRPLEGPAATCPRRAFLERETMEVCHGIENHAPRLYRDRRRFRAGKGEAARDAAEQHRFERDVMDEVRPLGAIEPGDFRNCPSPAKETVPAPTAADRAQGETLVADPIAMRAHASDDHDIEAGRPGGARRWQTVRAEIPILCYEEEKLGPPRCGARREASRQVQWFCDNG